MSMDSALEAFYAGLREIYGASTRDTAGRTALNGAGRVPAKDALPAPSSAVLTPRQMEQFLQYRQELLDWNTRINLTAITDPGEVLSKHFLDSLSLLLVYDRPAALVLDIGAGAGFPGLPLKIMRPQWQVVLLEATGKKVTFIQHVIAMLDLKDVVVVHGRAEELALNAAYRSSFDLVTARAVASLPTLLEYAAPYCRAGGKIILPKKGDLAQELVQGKRAAQDIGAVLRDDVAVRLPGLDDGRRLLVWEQARKCPAQYPRSGALMAKSPLGTGKIIRKHEVNDGRR